MTTVETKTTEISTVDALWVLIQSQSKRVRQALTKQSSDANKQTTNNEKTAMKDKSQTNIN